MNLRLCVLLVATVAAIITPSSHAQIKNEAGITTLEDGTHIQWQEFPGMSKLAALRYVFTTIQVVVNCPGQKDFAVYVGRSMPDVRKAYAHKDRAWCGWDRFIGNHPDTCKTPVFPVGATYVAVAKPKAWFSSGEGSTTCSMERSEEFAMPRFLAAAVGTFLFWSAPALSESTPFRLTGGALGFMATSLLVVLFIMYRSVPQKRTLFVGSAVFGSTMAAAARYAFGTWLPSARQLFYSPMVLAYFIVSGLSGLAVTYYYNDNTNQKINTILKVALQLVGLLTVGLSASMPEGTVALLTAVLGSKIVHTALEQRQGVKGVRVAAQEAVATFKQSLSPGPAAAPFAPTTCHVDATALPPLPHPHVNVAPIPSWLAGPLPDVHAVTPNQPIYPPAAPAVSPLIEKGLVLNEETGRTIQIGKPTYNKLIKEGYTVDRVAGTLTPPPAGARAADADGEAETGAGTGNRRSPGRPKGSKNKKSSSMSK